MDAEAQAKIDETLIALDGTPNKSRLGANAILGVSLAVAKAAAEARGLPLYRYVGGTVGAAAAGADDEHRQRRRACRQSDRLPGIHDHAGRRGDASPKALRMGVEVFQTLKKALHDAGHNTNVGDEGGFAPNLKSADDALGFVMKAIEAAGYKAGRGRRAGARSAPRPNSSRTATMSMKAKEKRAPSRSRPNTSPISSSRYPIVSIEDGMAEDDFEGWKRVTDLIGDKCQLVGDDLFVTNVDAARRRHQARARQLDPGQGQPDRHADRDARRGRDGAQGGLHRGDVAPLGRDRGLRPSPTSRSRPIAGRSRPARSRAPTAPRSTISSCASRRNSGAQAQYAGPGGAQGAALRLTSCASRCVAGAMNQIDAV